VPETLVLEKTGPSDQTSRPDVGGAATGKLLRMDGRGPCCWLIAGGKTRPIWNPSERRSPGSRCTTRQKSEPRLRLRQTEIVSAAEDRGTPGPLRSRASWIAGGLILQAAGAGGVAAYVWFTVRHQDIGGHVTAATIRLAWHSEVHTRPGLAVLAAGALIYAAGSVLMARPYVTRPVLLFVAVPVAAVAGLLVLGILAFILGLLTAALESGDFDFPGLDSGGGRRSRKRPR
jgi:hypothetical protein